MPARPYSSDATFGGPWSARLGGLALLVLALLGVLTFPVYNLPLTAVLVVYILLLSRYQAAWLILLPLLTVTFDLTQSSGRFLINEWDYFVFASIAVAYLGRQAGPWEIKPPLLLIGCFVIYVAVRSQFWLLFPQIVSPAWSNFYYKPEYGAKLSKGAIWALLITPVWLHCIRSLHQHCSRWLVAGASLASLALLLSILWERHIPSALLEHGLGYGFFNALLNTSNSYRVTGLFSDMHTGGEVIDGIIMLLLPVTLYGLTIRHTAIRLLSLLALLSLLYITMVGYTRTTYAATALTLLIFGGMMLQRRVTWQQLRPWLPPAAGLLILTLLVVYLTGNAGALILTASLLGCWASIKIPGIPKSARIAALTAVLGFAIYQLVHQHFTNKWITPDTQSTFLLAVTALLLPLVLPITARRLTALPTGVVLVILLTLLPASVLTKQMLGGYKINERMTSAAHDLQTRLHHWQRVLHSGNTSVMSLVFGNGIGTFPRNYLLAYPETVRDVGSFEVTHSNNGTALVLGGGRDMAIAQRMEKLPHHHLRVTAVIDNPGNARIGVYICERNVIFASNTTRNCSGGYFQQKHPSNKMLELQLDTHTVGADGPLTGWPTFFHIKNYSEGTVIRVHKIQVFDGDRALLRNSDFSNGMDNWFFYDDFSHLPWHIKNTYLHWYYEMGLVGTALLALLLTLAVRNTLRLSDPAASSAIIAGMTGFGVIAMFGTPLDSARVSLWFYLLLFALVSLRTAPHLPAGKVT